MPHDDHDEVNLPHYRMNTPQRELQPHEAMASIRWYVNELEQLATGVYMNSPRRWTQMSAVLHDALNGVARLYECTSIGCTCPFPPCPNGVCAPECTGRIRYRLDQLPDFPPGFPEVDPPAGPGAPGDPGDQ